MRINFENSESKEIYKVGNIIKSTGRFLYLVVENCEGGYSVVNLTDDIVSKSYETLGELANAWGDIDDEVVNAQIVVS